VIRKRSPIVLEKLPHDNDGELKEMLAELQSDTASDPVRPARWNRRFAASGKNKCASAPRIRL
jgi:hypothetical protein